MQKSSRNGVCVSVLFRVSCRKSSRNEGDFCFFLFFLCVFRAEVEPGKTPSVLSVVACCAITGEHSNQDQVCLDKKP